MSFKKYTLIYLLLSVAFFVLWKTTNAIYHINSVFAFLLLGPLSALHDTVLYIIYGISSPIHLALMYGFFRSHKKSLKTTFLILALSFWIITGYVIIEALNGI